MWREMSDSQKEPYRAAYHAEQAAQQHHVGPPLPTAKLKVCLLQPQQDLDDCDV